MNILCECGHARGNHGIQNGCMICHCVLSRDGVEIASLRQRLAAAEAALEGAQEAFEILADAPLNDGWIAVAPQFFRANLDALARRTRSAGNGGAMNEKKCRPGFHYFIGKSKYCQCGKRVWDEVNKRPQVVKPTEPAPAASETAEEQPT